MDWGGGSGVEVVVKEIQTQLSYIIFLLAFIATMVTIIRCDM